jgi:hypothetical protein
MPEKSTYEENIDQSRELVALSIDTALLSGKTYLLRLSS